MTDQDRMDARAKMGLRVIMKLHDSYPNKVSVTFVDAYLPESLTQEQLETHETWKSPTHADGQMAAELIHRMLEERVIVGDNGPRGADFATLPAKTRHKLGTRYSNGSDLLGNTIRFALQNEASGKPAKVPFVDLARDLDFEP